MLKADKSTTYTITQVDTALSLKADKSTTYTKTETDNLLSTKQPTMTSATHLTVNKLITRNIEPPAGFTDISLNANAVYFGNPVWLTATSVDVNFWSIVYIGQA